MTIMMREPSRTYFNGRQITCTLTFILLAAGISSCQPSAGSKPGDPPFTEAQEKRLRQVFKEEFAAAKVADGPVTDNKQLREEINKMVLARVEEELAKGSLKDQINGDAVVKLLKRAEKVSQGGSQLERVDLSQYPTVEGKIKRIMEEFEGVNSYSPNNPLVEQLKELGPQAKTQLYEAMKKLGSGHTNWSANMALAEALKPMLTIEDKDLLLEDFKSDNPKLVDVVRSLHLEEAGTVAIEKIRTGKPSDYVHYELINIALEFQEEEALPLILERLGKPGTNSAAHLAQTLDTKFPELDISTQLRAASSKVQSPYDSSTYAQLMLKRGMPEGLAMAADALLAKDDMGGGMQYQREQVRSALRRYANVTGSDEEVGKWLMENRTKLRWNASTQMFEE